MFFPVDWSLKHHNFRGQLLKVTSGEWQQYHYLPYIIQGSIAIYWGYYKSDILNTDWWYIGCVEYAKSKSDMIKSAIIQ